MTHRSRSILICTALLTLTGLSASQSPPTTPDQRPTTRTVNCTIGGCHAAEVDFPRLHGPVAAGACNVCHGYSDVEKHTFELKRTGGELCNFCHIGKTDAAGVHIHEPVARGECLRCHQPHGSTQRRLLRGATEAAVCLNCHSEVTEKAHVHTPLTEGTCTDCHRAHTSLYDKLLVEEGRSLCLRCHAGVDKPMHATPRPAVFAAAQQVDEPDVMPVHQPVQQDCARCHNPHSSDQASLLVDQPLKLCTSCHSNIASQASSAVVAHSVVTDDRACLNCHDGHRSGVDSLLKDWPSRLCLTCHNKPVQRADGTMVAAATDLIEPHKFIHQPLRDETCASCHDVHGGPHRNLLVRQYTPDFYQQFDIQAYDLCLSCHDQRMLTEPQTTRTGFRNGERNLHYIHVVEQDNGRSCRACHATHTAPSPHQLRQESPFGEWAIPIEFQPTDTGGGCAAGCHRARTYDRVNPVTYEAPAILSQPQQQPPQQPQPQRTPGGS